MNNFSGKRLVKWGLILSVVCFISIFLFTFRRENDLLNLLTIPTNRKILLLVVLLTISLLLLNSGKFMLVAAIVDFILSTAIALMFFSQKDVRHK